jgi:hypothetical protein
MQITQEYYTAEVQDIPISVTFLLLYTNGDVKFPSFTISLKVISDVIVRKSTAKGSVSVRSQTVKGSLGYTPIITTFGRGGAVVSNPSNPFQAIANSLYLSPANWDYTLPTYNAATILLKTPYISNVSASPAGADTEITTTTSLYLASSSVLVEATQK